MNSCKDCVCHLVCGIYAPNFNDILANGARCQVFKKETDFAEVVRCKDCKYCEECHYEEEGEEPYIKLKCKWSNYSRQSNDYCSYGERK